MAFLGIGSSQHDAYKDAEDVLSQYLQQAQQESQQARQQLNPYIDRGNQAGGQLSSALSQLLDPASLQAEWMKSYQTSPYAQNLLGQSREQGLDAASSMGLLGSSAALQNIENTGGQIVAGDQQQYLNNLMQKYMAGLGLGENLYGTGYGAASTGVGAAESDANRLLQGGNIMSGLEYGKDMAAPSALNRILGVGADAALNYFLPNSYDKQTGYRG
jgi:hypothetical protein